MEERQEAQREMDTADTSPPAATPGGAAGGGGGEGGGGAGGVSPAVVSRRGSEGSPKSAMKRSGSYERTRSLGKAGGRVRFSEEALAGMECGHYEEGGSVSFRKTREARLSDSMDSDSDSDSSVGSSLGSIGRAGRKKAKGSLRLSKMDDDLAKSLMARAMESMRTELVNRHVRVEAAQHGLRRSLSREEAEAKAQGEGEGGEKAGRKEKVVARGGGGHPVPLAPSKVPGKRKVAATGADSSNDGGEEEKAEAKSEESSEAEVVFVCGATGSQGGAVVAQLLASTPYLIRALTRNRMSAAAQALAASDDRVELFEANMVSKDRLAQGMAGCVAVFSVQNFYECGYDHEIRQGEAVASAALSAGVAHLVYSSIEGADPELSETEDSPVPVHVRTKSRVERHIREIGVPATVLRSSAFMETLVHPMQRYHPKVHWATLRDHVPPHLPVPMVGLRDMARAVVQVVENRQKYVGRSLALAGDAVTYSDAFKHFYEATQREPDHSFPFPLLLFRYFYPDCSVLLRYYLELGADVDVDASQEEFPCLRSFKEYMTEVLSSHFPPTWVPDYASTTCQRCEKPFGWFSRKHHCRNCGALLCAACTSKWRRLPHFHMHDLVRVCDECDSALAGG